jgi:probable phosphomutase (TIGR03848 family)
MTTFLLIRHALCDSVGRSIAGRQRGVQLNDTGRRQAQRLADRLSPVQLAGVYSSPLERAVDTARPIASKQGLAVQVVEGLNEIDFGDWTGRALTDLDQLPDWQRFNRLRGSSSIPGGESMVEVLARALRELDRLRELHPAPEAKVAVVSHGDVLRAVVAHLLGIPLNFMQRLQIDPASVSAVEMDNQAPRLLLLNSIED